MTSKEKAAVTVKETNRMVVIPEQFYAGGMYRMPHAIEVKTWERVHVFYASENELKEEKV
jgi:hypothetical protein